MADQGLLVLVRHGQSQWNRDNRFTGWIDVPLSDQGSAEARRAGAALTAYHFAYGFTSALSRAQATLRIILTVIGQPDLPVERDPALNERHYGDLQGRNKDETARRFGDEQVHLWRRSYEAVPPGGESLKQTQARVLPYYQSHILPHVIAGQAVLVVAHGSSLRALVMALDHLSPAEFLHLEIPTGAPLRYRIDADGTVIERGYLPVPPG